VLVENEGNNQVENTGNEDPCGSHGYQKKYASFDDLSVFYASCRASGTGDKKQTRYVSFTSNGPRQLPAQSRRERRDLILSFI